MSKTIKILIVDDHSMVRKGTQLTLRDLGDVLTLEAATGKQAREVIALNHDLELILLDIDLPDTNGLTLLRSIRRSHPMIPVVMISASDCPSVVESSAKEGARGFIHKSNNDETMMTTIKQVLSGSICFPPSLLSYNLEIQHKTDPARDFGLTPRQHEVLILLTLGSPNKVIADKLGCSEPTIRVHITAIFKALGVRNRTEATVEARQNGLVETS